MAGRLTGAVAVGEYYVYMLRCEGNRLYTGCTVDLKRRLESHISGKGGAKFTRGFRPLEVAALWIVTEGRGAAQRVEAFIKSLSGDQKRILVGNPSMLVEMVLTKDIAAEISVCEILEYNLIHKFAAEVELTKRAPKKNNQI